MTTAPNTYLDRLARGETETPADQADGRRLRDWLTTLEADCALFGETPEDTARMNAIKAALAKLDASKDAT